MRVKSYEIFKIDEWPKSRSDAEVKAMEKGHDTLLCLNKFGKFCGRSPIGTWCVGIPEDYYKAANFIYYENTHSRSVVIWSENYEIALRIFQQLKEHKGRMYKDLENSKFLCHSTPIENFKNILKDKSLLSYIQLMSDGKMINTVRFELKEPDDYLDYIDFCPCESISSEIVVASRQFGKINDNSDIIYKPGVRIYFKSDKLQKVEGACFDGLHTFIVYKKLSLSYAEAFVFVSKNYVEAIKKDNNISEDIKKKFFCLESREYWTPNEFINKANDLVFSQIG
ncbi:MAG: hypothetical protein ACREV6_13200 [Clostridium sp.]|uniref:hypothetical protein n=1 Tax=Clostridium sp. TaxID=1506 RepID=UPI003D6D48E0